MPLAWVVSSDAEMRRVIVLNLRKRGIRCLEVAPPFEGEPQPPAPFVIVLDIDPAAGLDLEMASALRRRPRLKGVAMILIAATMPSARRLAALAPARIVRRPLAVDELLTQVRESLAAAGPPQKGTSEG